ncbi:hypothetical protein [Pseudomonas sp. EL_65y_Pfl2_R96]|uniref:hypothetical protein n=1 Tax=Pseudomonas sp. EL_65y_Pfl2_R96 TaxID=3088699 RepID=UPI0030D6D58E
MNLASVSRENPFQDGITAVMPTNNQALSEEKTLYVFEKAQSMWSGLARDSIVSVTLVID